MRNYISPKSMVRYISTEHPLAMWSILIDETPQSGISGDAKQATVAVDDFEDFDDWDESEDYTPGHFKLFLP